MNKFTKTYLKHQEEKSRLDNEGNTLDYSITQIFPQKKEPNLGPIAYALHYFRKRKDEKRIKKIKKGLYPGLLLEDIS